MMEETSRTFPSGWIPIGERQWSNAWIGTSGLIVALLIFQGLSISYQLARLFELPLLVSMSISVVIVVVIVALGACIHRWRWPQPAINLDTSELRSGSTVLPLKDVDRAMLIAVPTKGTRMLILRISAGKDARAEFVLRNRKDKTPIAGILEILAEALARTDIALPVSKDDPTGKFARYNFPGSLTRDQAVDLALAPPESGAALPVLLA